MDTNKQLSVVGIGASAGGLESMRPLLDGLHPTGKMAFVVAQHMSPQHRSMLVELLARDCSLKVVEARDGDPLQADTVYVNPPNKDILVVDGHIVLKELERNIGPKPSVDTLFTSLAEMAADKAVGIILSGTGSDGAHGCRAIRAAGGITIAQDPATAKYDGMPSSAIRIDAVDLILSPTEIASQLLGIISAPPPKITVKENQEKGGHQSAFHELIDRIYQITQVDYSQYKEATLERQLQRRIAALRLSSLEEYLSYIDEKPDELYLIQKSFLISVTRFFRDQEVFDRLEKIIKQLVSTKADRSSIRIWVPGCATGEEVYSIAILICESLGRRVNNYDIKLFGTDIDMAATEVARKGLYPEPSIQGLPQPLLKRYFVPDGRYFKIIKTVREMCVFARQDLVLDPPFLKMDLISCRNLLIYLNNELQDRIINNFHYALTPGGHLLLGKSESVGAAGSSLFSTVDSTNKIFARREGSQSRVIINGISNSVASPLGVPPVMPKKLKQDAMRSCLLEAYAPPSVLINTAQEPIQFFGEIGRFLSLPDGVADFNILSLAPPWMRTELRALLYRALNSQSEQTEHYMDARLGDGQSERIKVVVRKLSVEGQPEDSLLVSFESEPSNQVDPSGQQRPQETDQQNRISQLENELAGTREHLQAVIEELETSNEELQSLNEELQASTEELQSSNEELETTNEELQATNEELTTVNDELQAKSIQLGDLNETLSNIQNSINMGLIVLDEKLRLLRYTPRVVRLFGIMPDDLGQKITGIPSHIEIDHLERVLMSVVQTGDPVSMEVQRQAETFLMNVSPYIKETRQISGVIITFADISELTQTRQQMQRADRRFRMMTESLQEVIWMAAPQWESLEYLSPIFETYSGVSCQTVHQSPEKYLDCIHPEDRARFTQAIAQPSWEVQYRLRHLDGHMTWLRERGAHIKGQDGEPGVLVGSALDVSDLVASTLKLQLSEERFRKIFENSAVGMALVGMDGKIRAANPFFSHWLGYEADELTDTHFADITHPDDLNADLDLFKELVAGARSSYHMEKRYLKSDGDITHALLNVSLAKGSKEGSEEQGVIAVIQDINAQVQARELIYEQANFDALTGLPNRILLKDRLTQLIRHAKRSGTDVYVLFVDLDKFKDINDTEGHDTGDIVLSSIADRLRRVLRDSDTVARFGGDEFVVVLNDAISLEHTEAVVEKLLSTCSEPVIHEGHEYRVSASIGIASFPHDSKEEGQLIQYADTAMYEAKKAGGNTFMFFSSLMNEQAKRRVQIKLELTQALNNNDLTLHYQPVFTPDGRQIVSAEALIRWMHPINGCISPNDFIPIAEESALIERIDLWVLQQAADFIRQYQPNLHYLSLNVTGRTLMSEEFFAQAKAFGSLANRLCLEITERTLYSNRKALADRLQAFKTLGYRISVDDFGTGYSNLSRMHLYPIDIIKIDKSFTDTIDNSTCEHPIVEAIFNIARAMHTTVIVEGLESEKQVEYFRHKDKTYIQGFLFSRPLSEADFIQRLKSSNKNSDALETSGRGGAENVTPDVLK